MSIKQCQIIQCCAVVNTNQRCNNNVLGTSKHCFEHHDMAVKLYLNYKKICNRIEKLHIDRQFSDNIDNIKFLLEYYDLLNKAYSARMEHRQYAFVPECYDEGHNIQFQLINNKIQICEDRICQLLKSNYSIYQKSSNELLKNRITIPNNPNLNAKIVKLLKQNYMIII